MYAEDRHLKYISQGIEGVLVAAKAVLDHVDNEQQKLKYLDAQKKQVLEYLKMEIEYSIGNKVLKSLEQHLDVKEDTMDTNMVEEYNKRYEQEKEERAKEFDISRLKKNQKYLELEQLITNRLGGSIDGDEEIECRDEETQYIDPWSKRKIEVPVRNKSCTHVYDKATALKVISRSKGKVKCPVVGCGNNNVRSSDLEVDIHIKRILERDSQVSD